MKSFLKFTEQKRLNEAARRSLSRITSHMKGGNVGIISAHLGTRTPAENNKHSAELEAGLKSRGMTFMKRHGQYQGSSGLEKERSFVVLGKKGGADPDFHKHLTDLGTHHGQESILFKPHDSENAHLHYLKANGNTKVGDTYDVGKFHPNHHNPYGHTVMSRPGVDKMDKAGKPKTKALNKTFAFAPTKEEVYYEYEECEEK